MARRSRQGFHRRVPRNPRARTLRALSPLDPRVVSSSVISPSSSRCSLQSAALSSSSRRDCAGGDASLVGVSTYVTGSYAGYAGYAGYGGYAGWPVALLCSCGGPPVCSRSFLTDACEGRERVTKQKGDCYSGVELCCLSPLKKMTL